tara:strand:- start:709 stop:1143 length:435 start_codon:yes stop_codon:yes gene_type:complete
VVEVRASGNSQRGEQLWQAIHFFEGVDQLCLLPITQDLQIDAQIDMPRPQGYLIKTLNINNNLRLLVSRVIRYARVCPSAQSIEIKDSFICSLAPVLDLKAAIKLRSVFHGQSLQMSDAFAVTDVNSLVQTCACIRHGRRMSRR